MCVGPQYVCRPSVCVLALSMCVGPQECVLAFSMCVGPQYVLSMPQYVCIYVHCTVYICQ